VSRLPGLLVPNRRHPQRLASPLEWPFSGVGAESRRGRVPPKPYQTRVISEDSKWPNETLLRRHEIATASFFLDNSGSYADSYNMTLELKIRRVGNSLGVIIPTEALALLNVREGDALFLTEAAEGSVRLSAQRPGFAEKAALADDLIQRYRNAFNELAK